MKQVDDKQTMANIRERENFAPSHRQERENRERPGGGEPREFQPTAKIILCCAPEADKTNADREHETIIKAHNL